MTRLDEARERCMDALDAWYMRRSHATENEFADELIDAYAALKRAQNGEPEDDHT
jgi:hypothetical protein